MYSDNKYYLWTPLVGFDMEKQDRGVEEYFSKIKSKPAGIALFVFNADIIYLHNGLDKEIQFPSSYCNYYGAVRNEIRHIQPWTNHKFKELVNNINKRGVETYISVMGAHTIPEDAAKVSGLFGYVSSQQYLVENQEACIEGTPWTGHTYVLKRLKDGSYFEDFFVKKVLQTLEDYGADGLHLSDAIFPPCMQLQKGDFSYDMIDQFVRHTGINLPNGMANYVKESEYTDISKRANYIWNNFRLEWIRFIGYRWNEFLTKLCSNLHAHGKKVMLNNCWTSEPFESLYRYGIDYKSLTNAGVDIICQEQQANTFMVIGGNKEDNRDATYCKSMLMRAYAPNINHSTITFAKDSTEEAAVISHLPCAYEREQQLLANYYTYEDGEYKRAIDSYFVDLADALSNNEWDYLVDVYEKIFADEKFKVIAPVLVWSDDYLSDTYFKEYIRDRRWSTHKFLAGVNKYGGGVRTVCKVNELKTLNADLFVPNVDLLDEESTNQILNYKNGKVILTLPKEKDNGKFVGVRFEDIGVIDCEARTVCYVLNSDDKYVEEITTALAITDNSEDIDFSKEIKDTSSWTEDVVFRKVSKGFITAIAKILKKQTNLRHGIKLDRDSDCTVLQLDKNLYRLIYPNYNVYSYTSEKVIIGNKFESVQNKGNYPAQPFKLVMDNGQVVANTGDKKLAERAIGFIIKATPSGVAIADIKIKN